MTDVNYRQEAIAILADSEKALHVPDFGYSGDLPIGKTWAWTFSHNRDSEILDETNWDTVTGDMKERFQKDTAIERFGHFLVGWVEHLAVRMLDKKGGVTKAGKAVIDWKNKLENYPVADEEELSKREYEQSIENIASEGGISEEEAKLVFTWLWRNNQEALTRTEENGVYYPSAKDIQAALDADGISRFSLLQRKNRERDDKTREFLHDQLALVKDAIVRQEGEFCAVTVYTGYKEAFPHGHLLTLDDDLPCDFDFRIDNLLHLTPDEATEYLNWQLRDRKREIEGEAEEQRQRTET